MTKQEIEGLLYVLDNLPNSEDSRVTLRCAKQKCGTCVLQGVCKDTQGVFNEHIKRMSAKLRKLLGL